MSNRARARTYRIWYVRAWTRDMDFLLALIGSPPCARVRARGYFDIVISPSVRTSPEAIFT